MEFDLDAELKKMTRPYVDDAEREWTREKQIELRDLHGAWDQDWIERHREELDAYVAEREEHWRAGIAVELDDLRDVWHQEAMDTMGEWSETDLGS